MVRVHFGPPLLKIGIVPRTNQKPNEVGFDLRGETKAQQRFEIEDFKSQIVPLVLTIRGVSSAGRAPALQAGGHRFDPGTLHQGID